MSNLIEVVENNKKIINMSENIIYKLTNFYASGIHVKLDIYKENPISIILTKKVAQSYPEEMHLTPEEIKSIYTALKERGILGNE